jgi:hypothetical protein
LTKFLKSGDGSEIKCEFECHDRNLVNIYLPNQEFRLQFNVFIYQKSDIFIKLDFGKFSVNKGVLPFPTVVTVEKRKKKKEKRERKRKKQAKKKKKVAVGHGGHRCLSHTLPRIKLLS